MQYAKLLEMHLTGTGSSGIWGGSPLQQVTKVKEPGAYSVPRGHAIQFDLPLAGHVTSAKPSIEKSGAVRTRVRITSPGGDLATAHVRMTAVGLHAGDKGTVTVRYLGKEYTFNLTTALT